MRLILIFATAILFLPSVALSVELFEEFESKVYEATGTKQEIAKRAKTCIASTVRNEEVRIADSSSGTGSLTAVTTPLLGRRTEGHSSGVQGGDVFVDVDIEGGTITANNRVDYKASFLSHNVKSTMTFFAKEGRFKIRHTNIESVQKNTGYMHNSGYSSIAKVWGTGW